MQITSIVAAYTVVGSYPYLSYGISDDLVDRLARQSSLLREVAHAVIAELVGNDVVRKSHQDDGQKDIYNNV